MNTGAKRGRASLGATVLQAEILDCLPEAVFVIDAQLNIAYENPAAAEFGAARLARATILDVFDDRSWAEPFCMRAIEGEGGTAQARVNGKLVEVRSRALPSTGRAVLTLHSSATRSSPVPDNLPLWGSGERFRELVESIPQLVWSTRADGYSDYFNRNWMEYSGRTFDEVKGNGWAESLHPEDTEATLQAWQKGLLGGSPYDVEYRLQRFDGVYRWFKARGTPVRDEAGRIIRWFGTSTDMDDQVAAEMALAESEQRFRELADSLPHLVFAAGPDGAYTYVNRRALEITGFTYEQALQAGAWESVVHPADWFRSSAQWQDAVGRVESYETEYRILHAPTGTFRRHLVRAVPVLDARGNLIQWFATATDIDDQRRTEEMLRHKQKLDTVGLLAGGIAHDFNNLLVGIMGAASCARDLLTPEPFEASHPAVGMLDLVVKSGDRAAQLTRQLLAYSGKGRFNLETCDVSAFIRDSFDLLRASIAREVNLQLDLDPGVPAIETDKSQLQQVVMNLVINAAEATGPVPTATVEVRTRAATLLKKEIAQFSYDELKPGRFVLLEVQDNGCGMTEETKSKIFDPFFTTKFTGRGLGLSAVSGIVRGMRGAIEVVSQPGQGTTFRVYFPSSMRAMEEFSADTVSKGLRQGKGRILVVDDEPSVLLVANAALASGGYEAAVFESAVDARNAVLKDGLPVSAALVDLSMPGMTGEELVRELRALRPGLPVIVSSGHSDVAVESKLSGIQELANGLPGRLLTLPKPYTSGQLLEVLGTLLEDHKIEDHKIEDSPAH